jgi:hypothetical protein
MDMETWSHTDMDTLRHGHMETWAHGDMETWTWRNGHRDMGMETWMWRHGIKISGDSDVFWKNLMGNRKREALQAIFLNPLTICSSCKRKFAFCPFAGKETNGKYPFAHEPIGLAHLWI